jgi:ribosomal-protein-alanine N-acetyltransferase
MVEVGYSIDPQYRRRGYGTAALRILIERARGEGVRVVRATIGPENGVSRGMVVKEGFVERGEQWDDVDGREIVWELDLG